MKNRSIIDLIFYISIFKKYLWGDQKVLPYIRSNYKVINFTAIAIEPVQDFNTIKLAWNIKKTNWDLFKKILKTLESILFNNLNQVKKV